MPCGVQGKNQCSVKNSCTLGLIVPHNAHPETMPMHTHISWQGNHQLLAWFLPLPPLQAPASAAAPSKVSPLPAARRAAGIA